MKLSEKKQGELDRKFSKLHDEGYRGKQLVAIALKMTGLSRDQKKKKMEKGGEKILVVYS